MMSSMSVKPVAEKKGPRIMGSAIGQHQRHHCHVATVVTHDHLNQLAARGRVGAERAGGGVTDMYATGQRGAA